MSRGLRAWWPVAAWAGVILAATSITISPPEAIPSEAPLDKIGHFGLYAVLGWLTARALLLSGRVGISSVLIALMAAVLFAAADEWHQQALLNRYGSMADWLADSAGLIFGLVACLWRADRRAVTAGPDSGES